MAASNVTLEVTVDTASLRPAKVANPGTDVSEDAPRRLQITELRAALEKLPKNGDEQAQLIALFHFAEQLGSESFAPALEAIAELKDSEMMWWRTVLLEIWAERDLRAALDWFELQPMEERGKLFRRWADTWARLDFEGLRQWLAARPEAERKNLWFSSDLITTLAEINPHAALKLRELYPEQIRSNVHALMEVWARKDPVEAARRAIEVSRRGDDQPLFTAMKRWAMDAPDAALNWINEITDPVLAERGRFAAAVGIADRDGIAVADMIRSRFPEQEQNNALMQIAWGVSQKDPESVIRWAQKNAEPGLRREMIASTLINMAARIGGPSSQAWPPHPQANNSDAKRLADLWITESVAAGGALRGAESIFTAIARQSGIPEAIRFLDRIPPQYAVAEKDTPKVLAYVQGWESVGNAALQLPPGARRADWLEQAVRGLTARGDLPQARNLTLRLPEAERTPFVRAMAQELFTADANASVQMLLELPQGRSGLQSELAQWLQREPRPARRWIQQTSALTLEEKQQLLTPTR